MDCYNGVLQWTTVNCNAAAETLAFITTVRIAFSYLFIFNCDNCKLLLSVIALLFNHVRKQWLRYNNTARIDSRKAPYRV